MAFKPLNKLFRPWLSTCDQSTVNYSVNSFYKCLDVSANDYFYNTQHYMNYYESVLASKPCWSQLSSYECLTNCVNLNNNLTDLFSRQKTSRVMSPLNQTITSQCSSVTTSASNGATDRSSAETNANNNTNNNNNNNVNKVWFTRIKRQRPKRFHCPHCHIAFSNNGQLKGHIRTHTGERPYVCDHRDCGKSFTRNEELTRHRRIHTGIRPYSCNVCTKRFGRKDHLKKHQRTHEKRFYGLPANSMALNTALPLPSLTRSSSNTMSAFYNSMYLQIRQHY